MHELFAPMLKARTGLIGGRPGPHWWDQFVSETGPKRWAGLAPEEAVALLAFGALGPGQGPTLVQVPSATPAFVAAVHVEELAFLFPKTPRPRLLTLASGLAQVLDGWNQAHEAAQEADDLGESQLAPWWHAIAHRREPDPGNARYWYQRVGRPPLMESVARQGGPQDPIAFVDQCAKAPQDPGLRAAQRVEMGTLLSATLKLATGP